MFPLAASAIASFASTLVSADPNDLSTRATAKAAQAESGVQAVYGQGQSEFAQALDQVEPVQAVQPTGQFVSLDTAPSLDTLIQATSPATPSSQPTGSMAHLQQMFQASGGRMHATAQALDFKL